jgi:hypothetical protein
MKIKFVKTFRPAGQAKDIPTYTAGETYTIADDYARKYIKRELAIEAKDEPKPVLSVPNPVAAVDVVEPPPPADPRGVTRHGGFRRK